MNHLGRALTEYADPPVNVLFVYNCNPAATVPDQRRVLRGLEREDLFTVVFEQVMTDTALYADVVLPATTFLEGYDFARAYGPINLELGRPVIDAVGESRSNADVFGELSRLLDVLRRASRPASSRRCSTCSRSCRTRSATRFATRRAAPPLEAAPSSSSTCFHTPATGRSICFRRHSNARRRPGSTRTSPIRRRRTIR